MTTQISDLRHADHPIEPQFLTRWSPRALTGAAVPVEQVQSLLEAARWAPSASNHQPWRLVWAVPRDAAFAAILGTLVPFNQSWASRAGALVVIASRDDVIGRDGAAHPNPNATFDAGAAWMSLALQAHAMGLVAHAMAGFDAAALAQAVRLPQGHRLHAVVAIGPQGAAEDLPEALRAREQPSQRLPLSDIAPRGQF